MILWPLNLEANRKKMPLYCSLGDLAAGILSTWLLEVTFFLRRREDALTPQTNTGNGEIQGLLSLFSFQVH